MGHAPVAQLVVPSASFAVLRQLAPYAFKGGFWGCK
jgi:hypothetical protein